MTEKFQSPQPVARVDYNARGNIVWLFGPQLPDGTELYAAPIPAPEGAQLPPLPHPLLIAGGGQSWFNAEQMRAYARAALAAPAPQAPVPLPDVDLCRLISSHEVYQYHPGALHEFSHEVIAEFCRVNGIPAPQTKEPTNDR